MDLVHDVGANLCRTDFPHPLDASHLVVMESEIRTEIPELGESNYHLLTAPGGSDGMPV
jgi:hypothetical protein